ncbi:MAG: FAD-dependent oxidoreductase [Deltaproteobacteria bacterium]|nr:FAD-dependent oxidoreductase [Deltaproteobacteria bacterium]
MSNWDHCVDFLVIGSGAAGMTAALRAHDLGGETLIVEKADLFGGSSALSGGVVWVPANPPQAALGIQDSIEDGLRYLEQITAGSSTTEQLIAYVRNAPRMMSLLTDISRLRFQCIRSYPGDRLILNGRLHMMAAQGKPMLEGGWQAIWILLRSLFAYYTNFRARLKGINRNTNFTLGAALIGSLRRSLMDRGVPLWLETSLKELLTDDGRVVGAEVERGGKPLRIQARRGILLAAGGFERNLAMREKYQPRPASDQWTEGCSSNTGDSVEIGTAVGGSLDLMDEAWWTPAVIDPVTESTMIMVYEKNLPGSILVNGRGQRFMNEAAPYNDAGKAIYSANTPEAPTIPAFLVFDAVYRKKYPCGPMMPGYSVPDFMLHASLEGNFFHKDSTLEGLANQIGIDPLGLAETVETFNEYARTGKDLAFQRGETMQDCYYSVKATGPNKSLAPLDTPPFYAVKVYPGDLGTKGGFRTDTHARVLTKDDRAIPGLFAAGNCSASVMGRTYPGAGATIGPAMTFGLLAAEHAMEGMTPRRDSSGT